LLEPRGMKNAVVIKKRADAVESHLPNPVSLALGKNLKRLRLAKDLSQVELAFECEMERSRVSKIECGYVNPSLSTLATICFCLGITLEQLFAGIPHTLAPTEKGGVLRRENQATHNKPAPKGSRKSPLR
jgi:transcriptional regulator with XRE-family HTH domain